MNKLKLVKYLDDYLKIKDYTDWSKNWLQVDCSKSDIKKIWYAVDANSYVFDLAIEEWVDLVIVHHWLFWWFDPVIVWSHYERVSRLIKNNIWLYACHLPLDAHPVVWNNIWIVSQIMNSFWIQDYHKELFWLYAWHEIGWWVRFEKSINILSLVEMLEEKLWFLPNLHNFWNKEDITTIWAVSWWWGSEIEHAYEKWYDFFITWEAAHFEVCNARELKQSILLWWHRETETVWVKLLAEHIAQQFGVEVVFLDKKY